MIGVDWGTSSLRAYRIDDAGAVREQRAQTQALLDCRGRFAAVLAEAIAGWDDELVLLAGMVGSRNGWHEAPYVACPAGGAEIAAGLVGLVDGGAAALPGRRVFIVPGLLYARGAQPPEVMRGEETQLLGLADALAGPGPHLVCLPGTHSKWVELTAGRIVALRTAMTGELYALLRRHSLLGALMSAAPGDDVDDAPAFARGLAAGAEAGGLLHHLFGVRTLGLFDALAPAAAPSYLSGLLIGHELRALLPAGNSPVHLVGGAALQPRYARALSALGRKALGHGEAVAARGLHRIARAAGLVADGA